MFSDLSKPMNQSINFHLSFTVTLSNFNKLVKQHPSIVIARFAQANAAHIFFRKSSWLVFSKVCKSIGLKF